MTTTTTRRVRPALFLISVSGLLLAAGCGSSPGETAAPSAPVTVSIARVESVDLPARLEAGGIVQARSTAHVTSRVVAPILDVHVRPGDRVTRGERLVTLDSRELSAHAERARASFMAATEAAAAAQSRTTATEAALRLAGATHTRISGLHDKRSATPQELDQATASLQAAESQVQSARADALSASAARDAARAEDEAAAVTRSYSILTSPFDGRVAERLADPGSLAAPGVPLVVIEEAGPVRLEVRLDQSRAGAVASGQQAEARLDTDPTSTWMPVRIVEVGRADPASHTVLIKLELPAGTTARTGSFGRARFAGEPRRALAVPSSSLIRRAGLTFAFAVDTDNVARLRPLVAGAVDGDKTEILAGLTGNERVVIAPPPSLTDGSHVTVDGARQENQR